MTVGERIKKLRTEQNMTQDECADKLGVSRQSLSGWENGRIIPEFRSIIAVCDLFHVSFDEMVREDEAVVAHMIENGDIVENGKRIIRRICFFAYLTIWAIVIAVFWIAGGGDDTVYAIVAYDVILSALTAIVSFFIGCDRELGKKKWFLTLFYGAMHFLAGYLTTDLADYLISGDLHLPDFVYVLPGLMISLAGISAGEIWSLIRKRTGRKRQKKEENH